MESFVLPGGVCVDGEVHRVAELRPLTGRVERALFDQEPEETSQPAWVSRALAAAVARVGTVPMDRDLADSLAVGDRAALMLGLAIRYVGDSVWLTPHCARCGERFDVRVVRSELQSRPPAAATYPNATAVVGPHRVMVRGPCGTDQFWLARFRPPNPLVALIARCVISVDGAVPDEGYVDTLSRQERTAIETAIEQASPDVDCTLRVKCPECTSVQDLDFNPYGFGDRVGDQLDAEIHSLAMCYHWSESEILELPRVRRHRYLALIERRATT